jgi:tetratricopeptide (TPR) repeat protein
MQRKSIQIVGVIWTLVYASFIVWIYSTEPRSFREVATNTQVAAGTYEINQEKFNHGLALFRQDQFRAARDELTAADPAQKDPRTQFYIAYAFYREGWGRVYYDRALFNEGLAAVNRAINLNPNETLVVDDPNLQMHTPVELKAELEQGLETGWKDVNPLKLFRQRK